jgi:hypothetical protein
MRRSDHLVNLGLLIATAAGYPWARVGLCIGACHPSCLELCDKILVASFWLFTQVHQGGSVSSPWVACSGHGLYNRGAHPHAEGQVHYYWES